MNMKKFQQIMSYVLVALLSAMLSVSLVFCFEKEEEQSKLDALEELIFNNYVGEVDQTYLEDVAADAMVNALGDPWNYYVPADQYNAHMEQVKNAYVGIGVTVSLKEDQSGFLISQVTEGGPADEAGILAGDVIVAVAGSSVAGKPLNEVKNQIRGEENTQVEITVERDGKQITVSVTRKQNKTEVATAKMLKNKVGLVRIVNFYENCEAETIAAIEQLLEKGAKKLIFDVRFNVGGYVSQMVGILDYLLPEGPLFRSEDNKGNVSVKTSNDKCLEIPMAVLVNGESYSAAEFFAAVLSEYEAAVVVGEQTVGKGYFQYTYLLPDGSAVALSSGKYYTPNGVNLEQKGIMPDVMVPVDAETANAIYAGSLAPEQDPQIQAAVKALEGK